MEVCARQQGRQPCSGAGNGGRSVGDALKWAVVWSKLFISAILDTTPLFTRFCADDRLPCLLFSIFCGELGRGDSWRVADVNASNEASDWPVRPAREPFIAPV